MKEEEIFTLEWLNTKDVYEAILLPKISRTYSYKITNRSLGKDKAPVCINIVKPSFDDPAFEAEMKNLKDAMRLSKIKTELEKLYKNDPHCSVSGTKSVVEHIYLPADTREEQVSKENDFGGMTTEITTNEHHLEDNVTPETFEAEKSDEAKETADEKDEINDDKVNENGDSEKNDNEDNKDDEEEEKDDDEDEETDQDDHDDDKDDNWDDETDDDPKDGFDGSSDASSSDDNDDDDESPIIGQTKMIPPTDRYSRSKDGRSWIPKASDDGNREASLAITPFVPSRTEHGTQTDTENLNFDAILGLLTRTVEALQKQHQCYNEQRIEDAEIIAHMSTQMALITK
ncbi:PREDICTED: protein starmaker-like [Ipomoea nil]|uniref:protein starmaker-like n=1 Tax=Ipomoea nil TaxID=35883 RepID=UPI0009013A58|nr:PREDICTED: protein starmaker-like [Ipomoea nil]